MLDPWIKIQTSYKVYFVYNPAFPLFPGQNCLAVSWFSGDSIVSSTMVMEWMLSSVASSAVPGIL